MALHYLLAGCVGEGAVNLMDTRDSEPDAGSITTALVALVGRRTNTLKQILLRLRRLLV